MLSKCHVLFSGVIVEFISFPVISGFTSAAAIIIAFGQVKVCVCYMLEFI